MTTTVTDDEVLRAMTAMGLEADNKYLFSYVRQLMHDGMPLCCILFMHVYVDSMIDRSLEWIDRHMTEYDSNSANGQLAYALLVQFKYYFSTQDKARAAGIELTYTPCPACFLAGNFVQLPDGCAMYADEAAFPSPSGDPIEPT